MGKEGLREVAELCTAKAHYAADVLRPRSRATRWRFGAPFFQEFVLELPGRRRPGPARARAKRDDPGRAWTSASSTGAGSAALLVAVTEQRTREEIDALARRCWRRRRMSATTKLIFEQSVAPGAAGTRLPAADVPAGRSRRAAAGRQHLRASRPSCPR